MEIEIDETIVKKRKKRESLASSRENCPRITSRTFIQRYFERSKGNIQTKKQKKEK